MWTMVHIAWRHSTFQMITDAGATEFHGVPTRTCLALEPLPAEVADTLTGGLPLY